MRIRESGVLLPRRGENNSKECTFYDIILITMKQSLVYIDEIRKEIEHSLNKIQNTF
jgi:hypothetical protein